MPPTHIASLLKVITETCKGQKEQLDLDLAASIADIAVTELTKENQAESTELLLALGKNHCSQVMGSLLSRLIFHIFLIFQLFSCDIFFHMSS